jgi:hypothetical protein
MEANISGSLPDAWRTLRNLQVLTLDSRHLGGTLPESWSALTSMTNLRVRVRCNARLCVGSVSGAPSPP